MPPLTGETFHEKTKGKDVRTSNLIAAKVRFVSFPLIIFFHSIRFDSKFEIGCHREDIDIDCHNGVT